ncbi:hypothetical protein BY458DRAFT_545370 [Sporodiniella umbellata]|nr:hypothetical protein BY458DRAFT_545370 [Sporodiniella umbellata]
MNHLSIYSEMKKHCKGSFKSDRTLIRFSLKCLDYPLNKLSVSMNILQNLHPKKDLKYIKVCTTLLLNQLKPSHEADLERVCVYRLKRTTIDFTSIYITICAQSHKIDENPYNPIACIVKDTHNFAQLLLQEVSDTRRANEVSNTDLGSGS